MISYNEIKDKYYLKYKVVPDFLFKKNTEDYDVFSMPEWLYPLGDIIAVGYKDNMVCFVGEKYNLQLSLAFTMRIVNSYKIIINKFDEAEVIGD